MSGKTRCFSTARNMRKLDPALLAQVLWKFPDYLAELKIELPAEPTLKNMPYEALHQGLLAGNLPPALEDVLYYIDALGNTAGWDRITAEAQYLGRELDFNRDGLTHPDLAMKAWLHRWPRNRDLLMKSMARLQMQNRSSYVYYPPVPSAAKRFRVPGEDDVNVMREELAEYFESEQMGKGTNLVWYDFPNEMWFLIRYPGRLERHAAVDEDGQEVRASYKPAIFDAIVYHKRYRDLRLNTKRKQDHEFYRRAFGNLFCGTAVAFESRDRLIGLEPLKGQCRNIFKCEDIEGLAEIEPTEILFVHLEEPGREIIWRSEKEYSLLRYGGRDEGIVPPDTHTIRYAKFRYRMNNREKWEKVTVHHGRTLNYARDGDAMVVEEWLRRRKFIADPLGLFGG